MRIRKMRNGPKVHINSLPSGAIGFGPASTTSTVPVSAVRARDSAATGTSPDASVGTASDTGSADIIIGSASVGRTVSSVSAETTTSVGVVGSVLTNLTDTAASPERVTIAVNM